MKPKKETYTVKMSWVALSNLEPLLFTAARELESRAARGLHAKTAQTLFKKGDDRKNLQQKAITGDLAARKGMNTIDKGLRWVLNREQYIFLIEVLSCKDRNWLIDSYLSQVLDEGLKTIGFVGYEESV